MEDSSAHRRAHFFTSITPNCSLSTANCTVIQLEYQFDAFRAFLTALKVIGTTIIIVLAVFGNSLVIISVFKYERLRQMLTNYFIVSLAFADLLVGLLVMPFNAIQTVTNGFWIFQSKLICDIFNANDVLFSTSSIIHLCCISVDRYIAVLKPLLYEQIMTKRTVCWMLVVTWTASMLISYIPIHTQFYTTKEHVQYMLEHPDTCDFKVNPIYSLVSSTVSFWIPSTIIIVIYIRIYREAKLQEDKMYKMEQFRASHNRVLPQCPTNSRRFTAKHEDHYEMNVARSRSGNLEVPMLNGSASEMSVSVIGNRRASLISTHSTSCSELSPDQTRKLKREHKAAKTLGIVMAAFLGCWFPFFLWYLTTNLCGESCPYPDALVSVLFWIGYSNSALNFLIYAVYNREFRRAFKKLLGYKISPENSWSY